MTISLNIQDANGASLGTLTLFDDVYAHMQLEAAIIGIPVAEHIIQIITGHAQDIIDGLEDDA